MTDQSVRSFEDWLATGDEIITNTMVVKLVLIVLNQLINQQKHQELNQHVI